VFERIDALLLDAIDSPNPRWPDRETDVGRPQADEQVRGAGGATQALPESPSSPSLLQISGIL
jgi:hypothetical protein